MRQTCSVSYNSKGCVSFRFYEQWWIGGVVNNWHYGATYNLKTGKKLTLQSVVSGTKSQIVTKIVNQYYKKYKGRYTRAYIRHWLSYRQFNDYYFWLKKGKVVISCGA